MPPKIDRHATDLLEAVLRMERVEREAVALAKLATRTRGLIKELLLARQKRRR